MIDYNEHLLKLLTEYYLDKHKTLLYIRWDTWLASRGYINECVAMLLKDDANLDKLLNTAKENAKQIINSKLSGVLK